jgi:hypothetical protein
MQVTNFYKNFLEGLVTLIKIFILIKEDSIKMNVLLVITNNNSKKIIGVCVILVIINIIPLIENSQLTYNLYKF